MNEQDKIRARAICARFFESEESDHIPKRKLDDVSRGDLYEILTLLRQATREEGQP